MNNNYKRSAGFWSDHCVATLTWPKSAWALIFTLKLYFAPGSLIGYPVGLGAKLIATFVAWLFAVHGVLFWQSEGRWYLVPGKALVTCRPVWIEGDLVAERESTLARSVRSRPASAKVSDIYFLHLLPALYWHFCADGLRIQKQNPPNALRNRFARVTPSSLLWAKVLLEKKQVRD